MAVQDPEHGLKPRRPFVVERRPIAARLDQIYGAHPDTIAELREAADKLQNVPREWLETREDMCHGLRRVAGRLRQIADRIEVIEPVARPKGGLPKLARLTGKAGRSSRPRAEGQMEMML